MDFGEVIRSMKKWPDLKFARKGWNGKGIYIQLQVPDEHSKMTMPYIYMVTENLKSDNPDAPRGRVPWLASQTDMLATDWVEVTPTPFGLNKIEPHVCYTTPDEYIKMHGLDRMTDPAKGGCLCAHTMKEFQDYKFEPNPKKYDAVKNPAHYCEGRKYEPWDVSIDWELDCPLSYAIKYIARAGRKQQPGMTMKQSEVQDLEKAINCLKKKLDVVRGSDDD